ncbi:MULTISPECIES: TetR/AcrR family transcriptional regulator [Lysobacter]|uniref:TetR/AcrR family transcriptional regulator n=1 Tax=Lysobacter TaxID=68 RepID=UPI0004CFFFC8|nr:MULTISPECIES: TetR/AcrR family transcriptional regulator [Lysobacter]
MKTAEPVPPPPRERILAVASQLFYAHGIRAVGIDTIIDQSGVAKASFYKHFPSKNDLVAEVLSQLGAAWRQWLADAVDRLSDDPGARPLAVFDALTERLNSSGFRGCIFINSIVELADRDHAGHAVAHDHKQQVTAYLERLLVDAQIRPAGDLASQLMMLIDGAIVTALRTGSAAASSSAKEIARMLIERRPAKRRRSA